MSMEATSASISDGSVVVMSSGSWGTGSERRLPGVRAILRLGSDDGVREDDVSLSHARRSEHDRGREKPRSCTELDFVTHDR